VAKTLLEGVNAVLTKVDVLDSDSGLLTSLTDSARQTYIDLAVQVLNESLDHLYSAAEKTKPKQLGEGTITLIAGDQDYALSSAVVILRREFHLIDETNNHTIAILDDDGYRQIVMGDLEANDTGLPSCAAIRPTDGELFFDREPTAAEAGRIYKYRYDKELELTLAADTFPFGNAAFRALIPAAAELWKLYRHQEFSQGLFDSSLARAARMVLMLPASESWMPGRSGGNSTDPLEA
jgi:hypothetical protein